MPVIWLGEQSSPWDDLKDISPKWVSYLGDVSAALTVFYPEDLFSFWKYFKLKSCSLLEISVAKDYIQDG